MDVEYVGSDEVVLRRIPPSDNIGSTQSIPGGGLRATSARLRVKKDEEGLSCTRLKQTSPSELLQQLLLDGIDPEGWHVCRIHVSDVRSLGLDIIHVPTARDPGHCEIRGTLETRYTDGKASRLAKETRILTEHEINQLKAGAPPPE